MSGEPLLSFIVLSYNYEHYIGQTIRSILDQTVQDFEIVVVDDVSRDRSCQVIQSFNDPRIRLLRNQQNLGGAASYNVAVSAARGEWLVNLDADDWVAPEKSAIQLTFAAKYPEADIIGTHVSYMDAQSNPHPRGAMMEAMVNHDLDLNQADSWIGRNLLCRSSTMVRRSAHLAIGLDDPTMVRAPDYELWTRALRHGCQFHLVPERLTYYRLHAAGITFGDQSGTFLELSYAMIRNLIPYIEVRSLWPSYSAIVAWAAQHEELAGLSPSARYRLLSAIFMPPQISDYHAFLDWLQYTAIGDPVAEMGRRLLGQLRTNPLRQILNKSEADNHAFQDARDWWHEQSDNWQRQATAWQVEALDQQHEAAHWQREAAAWRERVAAGEAVSLEREQAFVEIRGHLADAERKLRWAPYRIVRKVLSPFFRL